MGTQFRTSPSSGDLGVVDPITTRTPGVTTDVQQVRGLSDVRPVFEPTPSETETDRGLTDEEGEGVGEGPRSGS